MLIKLPSFKRQLVLVPSPSSQRQLVPQLRLRLQRSRRLLFLCRKPAPLFIRPLLLLAKPRAIGFFEASLPVKLFDASNTLIASAPATAQADWMTEKLVPFGATLNFAATSTSATDGYLVISKDNPSGLPEHDASISIPIKFK